MFKGLRNYTVFNLCSFSGLTYFASILLKVHYGRTIQIIFCLAFDLPLTHGMTRYACLRLTIDSWDDQIYLQH
ncbi:hypothetical protein SUGI_0265320 [Cryptomeria japonica]|nr:hypothetical protein SUGI_0265320 [Cryptomeria japonica]